MKHLISILFFGVILSISPNFSFCQGYKDYIDPTWDNYYNKNPSGIESNFSSSDFINVIEYVNFIPRRQEFKGDVNAFKKALLRLDYSSLSQMMRDGSFYSRSKKHDDYFYLYNSYYQKIQKTTWDKYAPYLIPLMNLDGLIKFN